jgi:hypothetical protein
LNSTINSQLLIDLDGHGLSNGYFQSSIFGGGYLTPLGVESAISLNSKNWNIVGLTYVLQTGTSYDVEDFPLAWIEENNFATYSGNTFQVVSDRNMPTQTEYDAVTDINLSSQSLTTDFTSELLNKFTSLTDLRCGTNQIEILDVTNLVNLTYLHCGNNQLTVLDVLNKTSLTFLNCSSNNISVLETQNLTLLTNLICFSNSISVLDITNLNSVTYIHCSLNNITTLNATNLTLLRDFRCFNNNLTSLTLSNNIALEELRCYTNSISNLDLSDAIELNTLSCQVNNITDLDFSSNTKLTFIECFSNQLDNLVNSQILIDLDSHGLSNGYFRSSIFGGGSLTAAGQTAKSNLLSKGWTIIGI